MKRNPVAKALRTPKFKKKVIKDKKKYNRKKIKNTFNNIHLFLNAFL